MANNYLFSMWIIVLAGSAQAGSANALCHR